MIPKRSRRDDWTGTGTWWGEKDIRRKGRQDDTRQDGARYEKYRPESVRGDRQGYIIATSDPKWQKYRPESVRGDRQGYIIATSDPKWQKYRPESVRGDRQGYIIATSDPKWQKYRPESRDENGWRKNQLNEIDEYAREAKPTERGRVWEGASPLPRQEPQQFDPKNGAFSWILNHESVGGEWLQSHPYSHLGLDILRLSSYCLSTLILGIHLVLYSISFRCQWLILKGNA